MRVYCFDGGRVWSRGVRFLLPDGTEETRDMADPNHCYLIEHPAGRLMWDAGLPDRIHALPEHTLESGKFRFVVEKPLAEQMAAIGVAPETVNLLAFSHLQIDHAGNTGLFTRAETLLQAAEYEMAFGRKAKAWGYVRRDYAALAKRPARKLAGDLDVFGDGKVLLLAAPGHTPGHQVLFMDLPNSGPLLSGPLLLSGDLFYAGKDPGEGWTPAWNYDRAATLRTLERLRAFAAERGAHWVINHDPRAAAPGWME